MNFFIAPACLRSRLRSPALLADVTVRPPHTTRFHRPRTCKLPTFFTELAMRGAGEGTRTLNLRITNPPLCQLSYASRETNDPDYTRPLAAIKPSRARFCLWIGQLRACPGRPAEHLVDQHGGRGGDIE